MRTRTMTQERRPHGLRPAMMAPPSTVAADAAPRYRLFCPIVAPFALRRRFSFSHLPREEPYRESPSAEE